MPSAECCFLPLRLTAGQFLNLWLLRSARIIAGLERLFRLALLASRTFEFLPFFSAEFCRVCHELFLGLSNFVIEQLGNLKTRQIGAENITDGALSKLPNYSISQLISA